MSHPSVGERWSLLVVRELLLGPKRFTDLRASLPHASPNILTERLRDLEQAAVVRKRKLPPPYAASVYELTEWGRKLEPIVTQLGAWGARSPVPPESREVGPDSIVVALRSLFDPERAGELTATYGLRMAAVLTGQLALERALASGALEIDSSRQAAKRFLRPFPMPDPCVCGAAHANAVVAAGR